MNSITSHSIVAFDPDAANCRCGQRFENDEYGSAAEAKAAARAHVNAANAPALVVVPPSWADLSESTTHASVDSEGLPVASWLSRELSALPGLNVALSRDDSSSAAGAPYVSVDLGRFEPIQFAKPADAVRVGLELAIAGVRARALADEAVPSVERVLDTDGSDLYEEVRVSLDGVPAHGVFGSEIAIQSEEGEWLLSVPAIEAVRAAEARVLLRALAEAIATAEQLSEGRVHA